MLAGLASFTGTRRRFEPKGEAAGVLVVDDYAHNAGKVAAVVETAAALVVGAGRLVVVFQPHLYSRTRDFAAELGAGARRRPTSSSSWTSTPRGRTRCPASPARSSPTPSRRPADADVHYVPVVVRGRAGAWPACVRPGDLVLTVGAGDVTMIGPEVLRLLGGGGHGGVR